MTAVDPSHRDLLAAGMLGHRTVRLGLLVPPLVAIGLGLRTGRVVDVGLSWTLTGVAVLMGVLASVPVWRGPRAAQWVRGWQLFCGGVGVGLAVPFLTVALDVDVGPFGLMFLFVLVVGAFTYPHRWRGPLSAWTLAAWAATLWWDQVREPEALVLYLGSGVLAFWACARTADAHAEATASEAAAGIEVERRAHLLANVLRAHSLEHDAVVPSVVAGLRDVGYSEVAAHDAGADDLREGASASEVGTRTWVRVPVDDGSGSGAVVIGVADTPLTAVQREAIELLAEQAQGALQRASSYRADRRALEQLSDLDRRTQDFVSTVSHELRTPLTVVQGLGQTLLRRWDELDRERRDDLLRRINANAERLATMVRSLLDTSALEQGRLDLLPDRVRLRPLLVALIDRLALDARHPTELAVSDELEVTVDPSLFEHVIENLLTNITKHTPAGTAVHVRAERHGDHVEVEIADDGPGIATADLPHVLDRFFRGGDPVERPSGGLGLGLALARQIVRAHGSELEVTSTPGQGTSFTFSVPAGRSSPP